MTEKNLREIKRRFRPEKSNIPRIVGAFVNGNGQIISRISQSLGLEESSVNEMLLATMKKTLSGSIGTSLTEIDFSTKDVSESDKHALLMELRKSNLKDSGVLEKFYAQVISSVKFEGNYVILLANDIYDVPSYSSDSEGFASDSQFSYIICAVCPLKDSPEALSFRESDSLFHTAITLALLSSPEIGFMFPAFDDRQTNIYGALYYTRSATESHDGFCESIFGKNAPMPRSIQKSAFSEVLSASLGGECDIHLVRSVQAQVAEMIEAHKEAKEQEPLVITKSTAKEILANSGIADEAIERFGEAFDESFGKNAALTPKNILKTNAFDIEMPEVKIKVSAEQRDCVKTETINGEKYILIKVTGAVEINGININIEE